jgi:hypothetical protein
MLRYNNTKRVSEARKWIWVLEKGHLKKEDQERK